jgi:hypothetical protein
MRSPYLLGRGREVFFKKPQIYRLPILKLLYSKIKDISPLSPEWTSKDCNLTTLEIEVTI